MTENGMPEENPFLGIGFSEDSVGENVGERIGTPPEDQYAGREDIQHDVVPLPTDRMYRRPALVRMFGKAAVEELNRAGLCASAGGFYCGEAVADTFMKVHGLRAQERGKEFAGRTHSWREPRRVSSDGKKCQSGGRKERSRNGGLAGRLDECYEEKTDSGEGGEGQ